MVLNFENYIGLALYWSISVTAITLNSSLLLLIVFKTPRMMRPYSVLLFAQTLADLFSALCSIMAIARIIPTGSSALIAAFYGPCQYFGAVACFYTVNCMALSQNSSLNALLALFLYRMYVLRNPVPKTLTIIIIVIALYLPSTILFVNSLANYEFSDEILDIVHKYHPNTNYDGVTITGVVDIFTNPTLALLLYFIIPIFPIYGIIGYCQVRIRRLINAAVLSQHTKETHRKFLTVLTLQAIAPSLYIVSVFSFLYVMFMGENVIFAYCVTLMEVVISVINPVISLYYITPYREAVRSCFRRNRTVVVEVQHCSNSKDVDQ